MAQDFKRYFARTIGATAVGLPAAAFDTTDTILGIHCTNIVATTILIDVYFTNLTNNYYLVKQAPIPPGGALQLIDGGAKFVAESGDRLFFKSDTADSLDVWVSVVDEISG